MKKLLRRSAVNLGTVDSHQHDIVRLAWSRELGLPDMGLLSGRSGVTRVVKVIPDALTISFLLIGDSSAITGPEWAIERAQDLSDEGLASQRTLLSLSKDHSGRTLGPVSLAYAAEVGSEIGVHDPLISHDLGHVLALEQLCPPDDVAEADLTRKRNWFTLLGDDKPSDSAEPRSSAAYVEWQGILADMAVLTAPAARRHGDARVVGQLATNDAIDEGLIPQWRTRLENATSRRLAARLGYEELGTYNSVTISQ